MIFYGATPELEKIWKQLGVLGEDTRILDKEKVGESFCGCMVESAERLGGLSAGTVVAIAPSPHLREMVEEVRALNSNLVCGSLWEVLPSVGYCGQCGSQVPFWYSTGLENYTSHPHIIGAGLRQGRCPFCGSIDRARWVDFVLKNFTDIYHRRGCKIMHFAPEKIICEKLEAYYGKDYYTCDIRKCVGKYQVDITNIPFRDGMFDFIIVNHVLEHIQDEAKALHELMRCLGNTGTLVLSFPIATDTDTFEDSSVKSESDRRKLFNQEDHVRLYGRDFLARMERYGLSIQVYTPEKLLQPEMVSHLGLISDDVVMLCRKTTDSIRRQKGSMIVYGVGAHLFDMLSWHPELVAQISRVIDKNPQKVGTGVSQLGVTVEPPEVLKYLPDGTEIAISAIKYIEEIQRDIHALQPGLICRSIDDAWKRT